MKNTGNVKSNSYYNPDEKRHPPPTNMVDSERDSELEKFIRGTRSFSTLLPPLSSAFMQRSTSTSPSSTVGPLLLRSSARPSLRADCHPTLNLVRRQHPCLRCLQRHPCHLPYLRRTRPQRLLRWRPRLHLPSPQHHPLNSSLCPSLCQILRLLSRLSHRSHLGCRASPLLSLRLSNHPRGQRSPRYRHPPPPLNPPSRNHFRCNRRIHTRGYLPLLARPFQAPCPPQQSAQAKAGCHGA